MTSKVSWSELDYGSEREFPKLWRAFFRGDYWFCENVNGQMFIRSRTGCWFAEDPDRERFFIECDLFMKLENHYGRFYGDTFEEKRLDYYEQRGFYDDPYEESDCLSDEETNDDIYNRMTNSFYTNEYSDTAWYFSEELNIEPWSYIHSEMNSKSEKGPLSRHVSYPEIIEPVLESDFYQEHENNFMNVSASKLFHEMILGEHEINQLNDKPEKSSVKLLDVMSDKHNRSSTSRDRLETILELECLYPENSSHSNRQLAGNSGHVNEFGALNNTESVERFEDENYISEDDLTDSSVYSDSDAEDQNHFVENKNFREQKNSPSYPNKSERPVHPKFTNENSAESYINHPSETHQELITDRNEEFVANVLEDTIVPVIVRDPLTAFFTENYETIDSPSFQATTILQNNKLSTPESPDQIHSPKAEEMLINAEINLNRDSDLFGKDFYSKQPKAESYSKFQALFTKPLPAETSTACFENNFEVEVSPIQNNTKGNRVASFVPLTASKSVDDNNQDTTEELIYPLYDEFSASVVVEKGSRLLEAQTSISLALSSTTESHAKHQLENIDKLDNFLDEESSNSVIEERVSPQLETQISSDGVSDIDLQTTSTSHDSNAPDMQNNINSWHLEGTKRMEPTDKHDLQTESSSGTNGEDRKEILLVKNMSSESSLLLADLIAAFKVEYSTDTKWLQKFPSAKNSGCLKSSTFFEFDLEPENHCEVQKTGYIRDVCQLLKPGKKVLLSARPGFGKSTFCSFLIMSWRRNRSFMPFKLCLKFCPGDLDLNDICNSIIRKCKSTLIRKDISEDAIRTVFQSLGSEVLIMLDDVHKLSEKQLEALKLFLKSDPIFANTCFLFTRRTMHLKKVDLEMFSHHVSINGLTHPRLCYLMEKLTKEPEQKGNVLVPKVFNQVHYLSELSPMVTHYVCRALSCNCCSTKKADNVFDLLKHTFHAMNHFQVSVRLPKNKLHMFFLKIGEIFLEALVNGQNEFEESFLTSRFKKRVKYLLDFQILHTECNQTTGTKVWCVSSKVLMVFFSAYYVCHLWNHFEDQRLDIVQSTICPRDCTGDFVIGKDSMYFVGLLPEIVLKCSEDVTLKNASIEMYYDTERIENSYAFDSMNLLVRVAKKLLHRFGFEEIPGKANTYYELESLFEHVINMFSFDNSTVDYKIYRNNIEDRYFLKANVNNETEETQVTLRAVFRISKAKNIDAVYLDYKFIYQKELSDFLNRVISSYIPNFVIDELQENIANYLYALCSSFIQCPLMSPITISCTVIELESTVVNQCTFALHSQNNEVKIDFSSTPSFVCCHYDAQCFSSQKETVLAIINTTFQSTREAWITLKLF